MDNKVKARGKLKHPRKITQDVNNMVKKEDPMQGK